MTPTISPKRARTDRKPITARQPLERPSDVQNPRYGRFLAITIR